MALPSAEINPASIVDDQNNPLFTDENGGLYIGESIQLKPDQSLLLSSDNDNPHPDGIVFLAASSSEAPATTILVHHQSDAGENNGYGAYLLVPGSNKEPSTWSYLGNMTPENCLVQNQADASLLISPTTFDNGQQLNPQGIVLSWKVQENSIKLHKDAGTSERHTVTAAKLTHKPQLLEQ